MTPKQRLFVEEYLCCFNATEAARRAGYKHPNKQGPALLVNLGIKKIIEERITERAMTADEALDRLAQMARGDLDNFITLVEGTSGLFVIDLEKARALGLTHLIKRLRYSKEHGVEVELYDAQGALEKILRVHGRFKDNINLTGVITWEQIMGPAPEDDDEPIS